MKTLPDSALDIGRLINSLPPDVNKKISLHDLKRVCDNYNTGPCPNCYGGFQRPCQWCGDTGEVTMQPVSSGGGGGVLVGDAQAETQSGANSDNAKLYERAGGASK